MANLVFIDASLGGSVTASDLTRVRSHCMRGRNKKDGSRRSKREARRSAKEARRSAMPALTPPSPPAVASPPSANVNSQLSKAASVLCRIPPPPPPDVALVRFADELKPASQESMEQFFKFSNIKNTMYPIHQCVDFDQYMGNHVPWLFSDAVFFHTTLMGVFSMKCVIYNQPPSEAMYYHHRKALKLLNQRLSSPEALQWESTVWIIQSLALMGGLHNDFSATHTHLAGLKRIIELKGGSNFLRERPKLHFKIENLDLLSCLRSGKKPTLFVEPPSWVAIFSDDYDDWETLVHLDDGIFDPRLVSTYNDLQRLSILIYGLLENTQRLDALKFQSMLHSVQSRLIHLEQILADGPSLCICLGMLAFVTTVFSFPGKRVAYPYLGSRLHQALQQLELSQLGSDDLLFWLAIVSRMMVAGPEKRCVGDLLRGVQYPALKWEEARMWLLSVMWIGPLQDELGRQSLFDVITSLEVNG